MIIIRIMKRMKRNSILPMLVLTSIMGISSCSTDYMAYDVGLKDGIYFITDSVNYQFGMKVGEDFNYAIAVRLLGTPKHYDRKFGIELLEEETTAKEGLHYKLIDTFENTVQNGDRSTTSDVAIPYQKIPAYTHHS